MKDGKKRRKTKKEQKTVDNRTVLEKAIVGDLSLSSAIAPGYQSYSRYKPPPRITYFKKPNQRHFEEQTKREVVERKLSEQEERMIETLQARYDYLGKVKFGCYVFHQFSPPRATRNVHKILWHGTEIRAMADITKEGLQPGKRFCLFGSAIYLGEKDKALGYCREALLRVSVDLGRIYTAPQPLRLCPDGFDSVYGKKDFTRTDIGGGRFRRILAPSNGPTYLQKDEWAVYDSDRVTVLDMYIPAPTTPRPL